MYTMMMPPHRVHAPVQQLFNIERNDTNVLEVITEIPFDADPGGDTKKIRKENKKRDDRSSIQQRIQKNPSSPS